MELDIEIEEKTGNLVLSMDKESRKELKDVKDDGMDYWTIMSDLFESYSTNGSYTIFDAGDANPFVGLTSAPCISEHLITEDDGTNVIEGNFWYFDNYMILCEIEELIENGKVVFTLYKE